jgi:predicted signal transduction protein with EAL and GGDEF domain
MDYPQQPPSETCCSLNLWHLATAKEGGLGGAPNATFTPKRNLRGRSVIFSSELEAEIRSRGVIEHLLRTADFASEMELVFQPIIDARSERTRAFEVLARWQSPRLGLVSPADFIPAGQDLRGQDHCVLYSPEISRPV